MERKLYLGIVFLILCSFSSCQDKKVQFEEANKFVENLRTESETVGLAVTVAKDGQVIWSQGFGLESLEHEAIVDPAKTKFRIASISKALTSAAVGLLIEQGKLDVDLPVQSYVPYYPENGYTITTRQVAGHQAGIRHYSGNEFLSDQRYNSVKEGLSIFMNDSLLFVPGTQYKYSSYGYNLVSAVVEGASGEDFLHYMQNNVFKPLEMNSTLPDYHDSIISHRSDFYSMDHGKIVHAPYVDNSYKWAGGGFLSTTEDLVRFGNAMLENKLFSQEILHQLITPQKLISGELTPYGMGWFSGTNNHERKYYGHGGGAVGGCGNFIIYPDEKLVVAIYTNDTRAKVHNEIHDLAEMFLR